MDIEDFKALLLQETPERIVSYFLTTDDIAACPKVNYSKFCEAASKQFQDVEDVRIMGSGNWGFSLNPDKNFRPFNDESDIDTVIISSREFENTWSELRTYHRNKYYSLSHYQKQRLKRNGENVYSGFISPLWIPDVGNQMRFRFIKTKSSLSSLMDYREVNMLIFKNRDEVIDYYKRGIMVAKGGFLKDGV